MDAYSRPKIVLVGDTGVGKTSLLSSFANSVFPPSDSIPTILPTVAFERVCDDRRYIVHLVDSAGAEQFDRVRKLSCHEADILLICFAANSPPSFDRVKSKWLSEVKKYRPNATIAVMCTKIDTRDNEDDLAAVVSAHGRGCISSEEGQEMTKRIGASCYMETSALFLTGVNGFISTVLRAHFIAESQANARKSNCIIL